jgi:hypothetical protein
MGNHAMEKVRSFCTLRSLWLQGGEQMGVENNKQELIAKL